MLIAAVVGDANVLLSAAIGKAALRVITEFGVEVHVCGFNAEEVVEYLPRLASKYKLPYDLVELRWRLLPVQLHPEPDYTGHLKQARADLADRDPDDAPPGPWPEPWACRCGRTTKISWAMALSASRRPGSWRC